MHTATLLNKGQVLIAASTGARQSAELYDPTSGTFCNKASLNVGYTDPSAVLLQNGQAMAVGGYNGNGGNIGYLSSAELLDEQITNLWEPHLIGPAADNRLGTNLHPVHTASE